MLLNLMAVLVEGNKCFKIKPLGWGGSCIFKSVQADGG